MEELDYRISKSIYDAYKVHETPYRRLVLLLVEIFANGVITVPLNIILILFPGKARKYFLDILWLQIIDLVFCGFVKMIFKKKRPSYQETKMVGSVPTVDVYSFHSGHSSRASSLCMYALIIFPNASKIILFFIVGFIALSRILLARHTCLDVVCGLIFGCIQTKFYQFYFL